MERHISGGYLGRILGSLERHRIGLTSSGSREDSNTIESQISRWAEAAMATVWESLVRRVHDVDYWQFTQSWNPYVSFRIAASQASKLQYLPSPGFVAFDQYKAMLQDVDGKISGPRTVIAGFGAGVTESLLAERHLRVSRLLCSYSLSPSDVRANNLQDR